MKHTLVSSNFRSGQLPRGPAGPIGLAGPAGPAGPTGEKGEPASKQWAVVRNDAGIVRQSGGISVAKGAGAGLYVVTFSQSVSACAPVVSLSGTGSSPDEGSASATPGQQATQYTVQTLDSGGDHSNETFAIAVFC